MERNVKQVLSGVGFYGTLAVCVAVGGVWGWVLLRGEGTEPVQELPVTPQAAVSQPVTVPERVEEPVAETLKPEPVPVDPADKPEMPELPVEDVPVAAQAPKLIVEPLRGEVLTAFSMEELIYSPTMGDWRTHDGIDIAAKAGTTVLAASSGTVRSVTDDTLMGTTGVLEHEGGYETTYANLQSKPTVETRERRAPPALRGEPGRKGRGPPRLSGAVNEEAGSKCSRPLLTKSYRRRGRYLPHKIPRPVPA